MFQRSEIKNHPTSFAKDAKKEWGPVRGVGFSLLLLSYGEGKDADVLRSEHQGVLASWQRLLGPNQPDHVLRLGYIDGEQVDVTQPENMVWLVRPQQPLPAGEYALMLATQNVSIFPFTVTQ